MAEVRLCICFLFEILTTEFVYDYLQHEQEAYDEMDEGIESKCYKTQGKCVPDDSVAYKGPWKTMTIVTQACFLSSREAVACQPLFLSLLEEFGWDQSFGLHAESVSLCKNWPCLYKG